MLLQILQTFKTVTSYTLPEDLTRSKQGGKSPFRSLQVSNTARQNQGKLKQQLALPIGSTVKAVACTTGLAESTNKIFTTSF